MIRALSFATVRVLPSATLTVPVTMTLPSRFASSVNSRFVILTSPPFSLTLDTAWLPMSRLVFSFAKLWASPLSTETSYLSAVPLPVKSTEHPVMVTSALFMRAKLYALDGMSSAVDSVIVLSETVAVAICWRLTPRW